MAINSIEDIWNAVCEEIKKKITETAFSCFFEKIAPISLDSGELIIMVENEYMRTVIEQNYIPLLKESSKAVLGLDISIRVLCKEDEENIIKAEEYSEGLSFADFFTFSNFIVGSTNRMAYTASYAVADNIESPQYNPLVIYGPSGVGKTHLLLAMKNHIRKKYPDKKIVYTRGEAFTNQMIFSLQGGSLGLGTMDDFRTKFRNADVLLIDDIHFIAGKEQTQEEFFNTFNTLYQNNSHIVVTLDRPPKDIKTLDNRIRSRFESGLFADITPPDFETRVGIIKKKAEQAGITVEEDLVFFIAEHIKENTRQLEGVIQKLQAYISLQKKIPNIAVVQSFIRDVVSDNIPEPIKIERIIGEVATTYNVSESDILSNRRTQELVLARQAAMYIAREMTDLSYEQIGKFFAKDHTTVIHNVKKIEKFLQDKPYEKDLVENIINNLKATGYER